MTRKLCERIESVIKKFLLSALLVVWLVSFPFTGQTWAQATTSPSPTASSMATASPSATSSPSTTASPSASPSAGSTSTTAPATPAPSPINSGDTELC